MRLAEGGAACCVPGADDRRIVIKFKVYNPAAPQAGTTGVSISARGVPIMESAMRTGLAGFMMVETPRFTSKTFMQSTTGPCLTNTITVELKLNVALYARCRPTIAITGFPALDFNGTDFNGTGTALATSSSNIAATAGIVQAVMVVNVTADMVPKDQAMEFTFEVTNPNVETVAAPAPDVAITGIVM